MPTQEELMTEIATRLKGMGEAVSDERLTTMIKTQFEALVQDQSFVRKMRFAEPAAPLVGSKYARWGLGIEDIEFLYDLEVSLQGQKRTDRVGVYEGPSESLRNAFTAISKAVYMPEEEVRRLDMRALDDLFPRIPLSWLTPPDRQILQRGGRRPDGSWAAFQDLSAYAEARGTVEMDTAQSGFGSQLIGAQYVSDLWTAAREESRVFGLIDTFEMTAPTTYLPVEVDIPEMLFVSETASDTPYSSQYATSKTGSQRVQVTAKKFIINQLWSGEMEEDSIIPFVPFLRRQAQYALAYYSDSVVLNGDTVTTASTNINLIDGTPAATKHYLAFDGIRKVGLLDNTNQKKDAAGGISLSLLNGIPGRMIDTANQVNVDWGHPTDPTDLVHIVDPVTGDNIGLLGEVITWRQFNGRPMLLNGTPNGLLNGQVGEILGRPIITSIALPRTDATGKVSNTGSNNTKGSVLSFNRRGCKIGWRRRIRMESERILGTDQTRLIYSLRLGFGRYNPTGNVNSQKWADVIYDIT